MALLCDRRSFCSRPDRPNERDQRTESYLKSNYVYNPLNAWNFSPIFDHTQRFMDNELLHLLPVCGITVIQKDYREAKTARAVSEFLLAYRFNYPVGAGTRRGDILVCASVHTKFGLKTSDV